MSYLSRCVSRLLPLAFITLFAADAAGAEPPRVVVSVPPVHSLVSAVAGDRADLHLLVRGQASPHDHQLRPSDAQALEKAQLVVWVGPMLEQFLERPLDTLAGKARVLTLSSDDSLHLYTYGEEAEHEKHEGEEHKGEKHDDDEKHEGEKHGHDDHHDHHEGGIDPHLWLSPENAAAIVRRSAELLSELDPAGAADYARNRDETLARIEALDAELKRRLSPVRKTPFVVFHDAFGYLERHYGLAIAGTITVDPSRQPGARRLREIRQKAQALEARCIFGEPQFRAAVVEAVAEAADLRMGRLDPLGLDAGPEGWFALMRGNAEALATCLSGS